VARPRVKPWVDATGGIDAKQAESRIGVAPIILEIKMVLDE
jgi:hypothetical protein